MNGIIMRIKMNFCLRKLKKLWTENNDTIFWENAEKFSNTRAKLEVLRALQSIGCVDLSCHDNSNRPYIIRAGERSYLYALERSELWLNRIISFIAGILTMVAADYIIRFLQAISSQ